MVHFTYDNEHYFLHDDSDEDRCLGLYHKPSNKNPEVIFRKITLAWPTDYIKLTIGDKYKSGNSKKVNIVYSHINKEYFVKKLAENGFIIYDKEEGKTKMTKNPDWIYTNGLAKQAFIEYMHEEFPTVYNNQHSMDLLSNIVDYATSDNFTYTKNTLFYFLHEIIPEVMYEEIIKFMDPDYITEEVLENDY